MPKTTLAGHPLHPQLIGAPTALMPFSLILDLMHLATGKRSYAEAAYYSMAGGYAGGLAAAAAGAGDYLAIPSGAPVKRMANVHAGLNLGLLALYSVNLLLRRGRRPPTGTVPILLNAFGNLGFLVSAWYGGDMVYRHGMRVEGVSPVTHAPEVKPPGDRHLAEMFGRLAAGATSDGSEARDGGGTR